MALSRFLLLLLLLPALADAGSLRLAGSDGVEVVLAAPAQRIVSLSPHFTDALLALGARAQLAGVIDDHERRGAHVRSRDGLPLVGDAGGLNHERLLALRPDLVLAWGGGTPRPWVARLRQLGLPVLVLQVRTLAALPAEIALLGRATGREAAAAAQAAAATAQLQRLARLGGEGPRLRFFYEAWRQPLYSLEGGHLLSQLLALCGADNILPPGPVAAPLVSAELVLRENPDVLVVAAAAAGASQAYWGRFPHLAAVRQGQWLLLDDPRLARPGAGMLAAAEPACRQISTWRKRKALKTR